MAVFIDLMRVFETVDRSLLLKKLEKFGICEIVLKWFKNYFQNRSHFTKIMGKNGEEVKSSTIETNFGVQQGSILGPLLFILFVNDIDGIFNFCSIHMFADDILLFLASKDVN